jgi:hypothetical protein
MSRGCDSLEATHRVTHTRLSAAIFETLTAAAPGEQVEVTQQRNSEITKKHCGIL